MITTKDDGYVRTHDDAESLIRNAVPGAHVEFWTPDTTRGRTRSYLITLRRFGRQDHAVQGAYTLPAPAEQIANHARTQCAAYSNERA